MFEITSIEPIYANQINIIGNTKTNDEVYRRELRQFESSTYAESKIDRSKIRLQRLKFVNNVEVKNNNRITKETVITFGGIELGKNYSQEQLNDILLDLYSTNFFSDIKFEIQGNTLIVIVDERKIIHIKNNFQEFKFLPLICYEIIYSGRIFTNSDFDFIINLSKKFKIGSIQEPLANYRLHENNFSTKKIELHNSVLR